MDYLKLYEETFAHADYNQDGSLSYQFLLESVDKIDRPTSILDIGSGRGNVIKHLLKKFPIETITSADLKKFHDYPCKFVTLDLSKNFTLEKYDLITCLDVMEHIEKEFVDNILKQISLSSKYQIFSIANHMECPYEQHLHLIRHDKGWWETQLKTYFEILETKDIYDCLYGFLLKTKV